MKQRVKQNILFKQHDHATVLSLLTYFDFDGSVSSHMTYHRYICIAVATLYFLSYLSSSVFFCMKILSLFFWRKLCLVSLILLHYWAIQIRYFWKNYFQLKNYIQFIWRFEKRLMVLQYFIIDNNTRMSVFLWEMFFNNMNITSTWCINQFLFLNTFSFLLPQSFLVINWISISLDSLCLESSGSFHFAFEFLDISCPFIDDVKVTRVNLKCMFTKILTMFMTHTWKNKGQKGEYRDSLRISHEQPFFSNHRK